MFCAMTLHVIRRALLSASDKSGLVELARALAGFGVELISTGGTRKALADAGVMVRDIADVTGFPEILDGRVKTLHPRVHAGILAMRDNPQHVATLEAQKIEPIDLVVCNLYPFEAVASRAGASHEEIVENIDVGGPSMVRAAAKNYRDVVIATDPSQYPVLIEEMRANQRATTLQLREKFAATAFARTAKYDSAIAHYFLGRQGEPSQWPAGLDLRFEKRSDLRYGENPHQKAALYVDSGCETGHETIANAEILHGKELSYNNLLDLDSAWNLVREFGMPAAAVIKHSNPCGGAVGATLSEAFARAYEGDPLSAYGGVLAFNHELDEATAMQITEPGRFIECVIAPGYSKAAFNLLTTRPTWSKNVRILRISPPVGGPSKLDFRRIDGGLLVQDRDLTTDDFTHARVVTQQQPTEDQLADLKFAWLVAKHVKSNAIVLAKGGMVVGVGAGQMSRVDSVHIACRKAGERVRGSVMASDAFFPFRDNIDEAAKAGVVAVVQPGGSMRDKDSIAACDEHGMAMVLTGVRHFRH
jgi:phosphoribosylaminoimidazolecarboxamide formyltransferase/IMP cyclohydrolase